MSIHNTYAVILEEKIVNIIVADNFIVANECARSASNDASVAECNNYRCSVGDIYKDGTFYFKDGVTPIPEEIPVETKLDILANQVEENQLDMAYQICLLQLGVSDIDININEEGGC